MGQVARDRRLGELERRHQIADAQLSSFKDQGKDPETNFFGETLKGRCESFHTR